MTASIGWTYSHRQATWLEIDPATGLKTVLDWQPGIVRLGVYWDESEPEPGVYTFDQVEVLLKICESAKQPVLLSVGMKAPRWPEFYFPSHVVHDPNDSETQKKCLSFIEQTVKKLHHYECITHWQVENEPLDPSGPNNQAIPFSFLEEECALVRSLDTRPIIINLWGNDVAMRGLWPQANALADIVGLDLYYKQHLTNLFGKDIYGGPRSSDATLRKNIEQSPKPTWITELQAEPWERDEAGYKSENPPSMSLQHLEKNIKRAQTLGAEVILLWGAEYWLWKKQDQEIEKILKNFC